MRLEVVRVQNVTLWSYEDHETADVVFLSTPVFVRLREACAQTTDWRALVRQDLENKGHNLAKGTRVKLLVSYSGAAGLYWIERAQLRWD
jgi:hypothetical protein